MNENLFDSLVYLPGVIDTNPELLSRYLPPIPIGVISTWLKNNVQPGSWILDPFGSSPRLALEAAQAGYRILVTANNPIARFLIEISAYPPSRDELKSALYDLAASYKGDERIEPHIRSLYNTHCARCGQVISANAFTWEQDNPSPLTRIYSCPYCGDSGERPCTSFDVESLRHFSGGGIHKARALERVIASNDPDRMHVEQALSVYLPRAIYAIITIINKLEGLSISPAVQKNLSALLLHAFDQSNVMWRVPAARERRRQLSIPRHFRENNIWDALEQAVDLIGEQNKYNKNIKIASCIWPDLPPNEGGICIFEGRLSSLINSLSGLNINAVTTVIPRPNQAFWTLSALWAGWLWGREAVGSFKSVLHRQRYDWAWHSNALSSIFSQLNRNLSPSTKILGLLTEIEPGFLASAFISAAFAGCDLQGIALRQDENQAQIKWETNPGKGTPPKWSLPIEHGSNSAKSFLEHNGEPANYLNTLTAAMVSMLPTLSSGDQLIKEDNNIQALGQGDSEPNVPEITPASIYSRFYSIARDTLSYRAGFLRFNLQDFIAVESSSKTGVNQNPLFSLDATSTEDDSEEFADFIPTQVADEIVAEKDHPTRLGEISESVLIWLRNQDHISHKSMTDQYELYFLDYIASHPNKSYNEVDSYLCDQFRGLYTPDPEFVQSCLLSYGEKDTESVGSWHLRHEDDPTIRKTDIEIARKNLHQIGIQLGLSITEKNDGNVPIITWESELSEFNIWFYLTANAAITEIVVNSNKPSVNSYIVLPGSRANIIINKLERDPRLNRAFQPATGDWRFLKFRHLRSLSENPILSRDNLEQLLNLDPLTFTTPQLRLI